MKAPLVSPAWQIPSISAFHWAHLKVGKLRG